LKEDNNMLRFNKNSLEKLGDRGILFLEGIHPKGELKGGDEEEILKIIRTGLS